MTATRVTGSRAARANRRSRASATTPAPATLKAMVRPVRGSWSAGKPMKGASTCSLAQKNDAAPVTLVGA